MNLFRPNVGFSAAKLLKRPVAPREVPGFKPVAASRPTTGDFDATRALAKQLIEAFEGFDYVVGPSGSCMATIRKDYPASSPTTRPGAPGRKARWPPRASS